MNAFKLILIVFLPLLLSLSISANGQSCGTPSYLDKSIRYSTVTFYEGFDGSSNVRAYSLKPGTDYRVRLETSPSGVCEIVGGGCNGANAPVKFVIEYSNGCNVVVGGRDSQKSSNGGRYCDFRLTTNPSSTFGGQVVLNIRFYGTRVGACDLTKSNNVKNVSQY